MTIRSYKFSILLFSFLILSVWAVHAQDTLKLNPLAPDRFDIIKKGMVAATHEELAPDQAWTLLQELTGLPQKATVGFTSDIFWIAFRVKNYTATPSDQLLEIDNPQIDWLYIYERDASGQFSLLAETGDKFLFHQRPILHRNFAIPLTFAPGETKTILVKIDKRNSSLTFPVYLWNERAFHEKTYAENLRFGIFFGIITLCLIYALMAFLFLRRALFGWYFILVLATAVYLFTSLGFSFQYLYPNLLDFNSYFRVYLIVILFFCIVKFSQNFLNLKRYQPRINAFINYILIFLGGLIFVSIFTLDFMSRHALLIIPFINTVLLSGGALLIAAAIRSYPQQRVTVIIYFSAWGTLMLGYGIMTVTEFGWIPVEALPVNPVLVGSATEMLIFSVGLTYQIRKVYNERNQLSLKMAKQQKELLKAYVEGTEKERERIARELHDDIGSRLGSLKRFITTHASTNQTLEEQIDILCRDVRTMSHQLTPPSMRITGLRQLVRQLVEDVIDQENLRIDVQFYDVPENLPSETNHHLFRIAQEAISNVLKHAQATEMDLQFFVHENELVMTMDDNGKGFDAQQALGGIGLQNMRTRTEALTGQLEISSSPGNGTNILIRIPLSASTDL
jgi:two-component system, sensor histidine kinase LadS